MKQLLIVLAPVALVCACPPPPHPPGDAGLPPGMSIHVVKDGDGHGALTSDPDLVDCDALCQGQDVVFPEDATSVTLSAAAARDALFESWSCVGTKDGAPIDSQVVSTADVTISDADPGSLDVTCTAKFRQLWTVLVEFAGTGTGNVVGSAVGDGGEPRVHCAKPAGADNKCTAGYFDGEEETLTPTADADNVFVHWSFDCQGTGAATLTMTKDMNCEALFCPVTDPNCQP